MALRNRWNNVWDESKGGPGAPTVGRDGHCCWSHAGKVFIFGGATPEQTNELFVFDVAAGAWTRPATTGAVPSPRTGATACTVSGGRVVLFGGADAESASIWRNDVHVLDLATMAWTSPATAADHAPAIRDKSSCCAIGSDSSLFCLFGGFGPVTPAGAAAAAQAQEGGEEGEEDEEMEDDEEVEAQKLTFGWFNDVHVFDTRQMRWTEMTLAPGSPAPSARCASAMCQLGAARAAANQAIVFGGRAATGERVNDVWRMTVDVAARTVSWEKFPVVGTAPEGRSFHTMTAVSPTRFAVFGGLSNRTSHFADLHVLDLASTPPSWRQCFCEAPLIAPRGFHGACVEAGRLWVYGGGSEFDPATNASTVLFNDVHSLAIDPLLH